MSALKQPAHVPIRQQPAAQLRDLESEGESK